MSKEHDLTTAKGVLYWAAGIAKTCRECHAAIVRTYKDCDACGGAGIVPYEWSAEDLAIAEEIALAVRMAKREIV